MTRSADGGARSLGYVPALDGVRALAVVAVMLFHAGFSWASGGFIGVSVFFTLSGFLITSLLLAEHASSGKVSLRKFYARRVRRLLPASYLCVALVLAGTPWWSEAQRRRLPGDALAALGNVFNWRAAWSSLSYRELFDSAPSPLAHFWSLSIEEQCYLVLPLLTVVVLAWGGRRWLTVVAVGLLAASLAAALLTSDFDLGYNATFTRAGEVLVGMVLAVLLRGRRVDGEWGDVAGLLGLASLAVGVAWLDLADQWLARGGLLAVGLLSTGLIVGVLGNGPLAAAFSWSPLVAVGKVSYGLYLFHWPVFQVLTEDRTGLNRWPLLGLRLVTTVALTLASYHWLERPIRDRRWFASGHRGMVVFAAAIAVLLVAVWAVPGPRLTETEQLLAAADGGPVLLTPPSDGSATTVAAVPVERPRVLVLGSASSAAQTLSNSDLDIEVVNHVRVGCPVGVGEELKLIDGSVLPIDQCAPSGPLWSADVQTTAPDVVVLSFSDLDDGMIRPADVERFPRTTDIASADSLFGYVKQQVAEWLDQIDGVPVVVYWPTAVAAPSRAFRDYSIYSSNTVGPVTDSDSLIGAVQGQLVGRADRHRVVVIGDSTSFAFAVALSRSTTELEVQYAGQGGCPFVPVVALKPSSDGGWTDKSCKDYLTDVPDLLASFDAEAVLIVVGGMELTEQKYLGDDQGYIAGSTGYQNAHDAAMDAFLEALGPDGPLVIVPDSPPIAAGSFSSMEMALPERLAALNAQIQRWADAHPDQVQVLPYAGALVAYEAEHGSIREDGSHAKADDLTVIMRDSVVPALLGMLSAAD